MLSAGFIAKINQAQRKVLLEHIDAPQDFIVRDQARNLSVAVLMRYGLLRGDPIGVKHPRQTELTEAGRDAVARILSEYAELLIDAGCLEVDEHTAGELRPTRMLARLRVIRSTRRLLPNRAEEVPEPEELVEPDELVGGKRTLHSGD